MALVFVAGLIGLRFAGFLLVSQDGLRKSAYLVVLGGDDCYERAAQLVRRGMARQTLLVEPRPKRLVQMGIVPSWGEYAAAELSASGVPSRQITVVPRAPGDQRDDLALLADWLRARPGARVQAGAKGEPEVTVTIVCKEFASRSVRCGCRRYLGASALALSAHVRLFGVRDERYDANNWWRSRTGAKELFLGFIDLAYAASNGNMLGDGPAWDPDRYEREL